MISKREKRDAEREGRSARLVEGSVTTGLLKLAGPMVFGMLSIVLFNVVDTYFVGLLGTEELAAIGFTFPVVYFIGALTLGLGTGAMSVLSRTLGAGDNERVRRVTTDSLILSLLVVAVVGGLGYLTMGPLFEALGAEDALMPLIMEYMSIWYFGLIFLVVPMVGNAAIRATGDSLTPALIMFVAGSVNAVLDPLFIFGWGPLPGFGIAGAAYATVISRAITLMVSFAVLWRRERLIDFSIPKLHKLIQSWSAVLKVGVPAAGTNVVVPLSSAVLTGIVATHGAPAVAAFGAGGRIEALSNIVPLALASAMGPFVGQNWGAKRRDRVAEALRLSVRLSLLWGGIAVLFFFTLSGPISGLFTKDAEALAYLRQYLWIVPLGIGFQSLFFSSVGALNAVNQPLKASALAILRALVLALPLAWLGERMWGVPGVYAGIALANVVVGITAIFVTRGLRQMQVTLATSGR